MDSIIYSASPLGAFTDEIFYVVFIAGLGLISMIYPFFTRREKMIKRVIIVCLGVFLLLTGIGMFIAVFNTYQGGEKTAVVVVEDKREVTRKCGTKSWSYCTDYIVEATDGRVYYDFNLDQEVWEEINTGSCYGFTYYPPKPLLADYLPRSEYDDLYETGSDFTRIEKATCRP